MSAEVGKRIREARELRGISAISLASAIGVSRATVYRYEDGYIEKLPLDVLPPIAEALHVSIAWLMGWTDDMTPEKLRKVDPDLILEGPVAELVDCYRQLDPERAARLVGYAQALVDGQQAEQERSKNE